MYCRVPGVKTGVDLAYSFHSFEDPYFSACLFSSPPVARRMMETIWEGPIAAKTQWYLDGDEQKNTRDGQINWLGPFCRLVHAWMERETVYILEIQGAYRFSRNTTKKSSDRTLLHVVFGSVEANEVLAQLQEPSKD